MEEFARQQQFAFSREFSIRYYWQEIYLLHIIIFGARFLDVHNKLDVTFFLFQSLAISNMKPSEASLESLINV